MIELSNEIKNKLKNIKLFLTDCDGCLTDGGMYYTENGDEIKKFSAYDGMGMSLLRKAEIRTGIVTGEDRELNRRRAKKLKLDFVESGCSDKGSVVRRICEDNQIALDEVVFVGDDINDLSALQIVGVSVCPANARLEVKGVADIILETKGGDGAIREIADMILQAQNIENEYSKYLKQ